MNNETSSPRNNPGASYDHQMGGGNSVDSPERDIHNPRIKQYEPASDAPAQRPNFGQRLRAGLRNISEDDHTASYAPDSLRGKSFWLSLIITTALTFVGSTAIWWLLKRMAYPSYATSYVLKAFTTAFSALVVIGLVLVLLWWVRLQYNQQQRKRWQEIFIRYYCYLTPPALVTFVLGVPLASTTLYLGGISVDQEFRTQYLTRFTDTAQLTDMNYIDLPTFYPAAWFWFGGRFANLIGFPGWQAFQPWAIISLALCAALLTPIWQRIVGSLPIASALAVVNTIIVLNANAEEPYAAVVLLGAPIAVVLAGRAVTGSNPALIAVLLYLGASATTYTLYTGIIAVIVVLIALSNMRTADKGWNLQPLWRLVAIGLGSLAIAALSWAPYYLAVFSGNYERYSAATRYLPEAGTEVMLPMFDFNFIGLLCLGGLAYLIVRRKATDIRELAIAALVTYGWIIASMLAPMLGHSLLGFRLNGMAAIFMATAGVFLVSDLRLLAMSKTPAYAEAPRQAWNTTAIFVLIFALGSFQYIQAIPEHHQNDIDLAYTDTDATGTRATPYPADASQNYEDINTYLLEQGRVPGETVVLTDEFNFLAFFPYRGFQALTAHYANPLGEFPQRNDTITQWAEASQDASPQEFLDLLDASAWKAPDVFIFKADASAFVTDPDADIEVSATSEEDLEPSWNLDVSDDIYPDNPNVRWRGLSFNSTVFTADPEKWSIAQFGPFAVVTRN